MRRFHSFSVAIMQPSTVGAAMDLESSQLEYKTVYDSIGGAANFSMPLALLATTQAEGVDTPFFTYFVTANAPSPFAHLLRRKSYAKALISGTTGQGITTPIEDAPPDTTPLTVGKFLDIPMASFMKKRKQAWQLAGQLTSYALGYSPEYTPASEYNDISCRLLSEIQRHMLETMIDGGVTWSLWTQEEVLGYLNQRLVRFIMETGVLQERIVTTYANGAPEVPLPSDLVDLRRVAIVGGSVLTRIDAFALDSSLVGWEQTSGEPYAYVEAPKEALTIQLVPSPTTSGSVEILYVKAPEAIGATCVPLPLPSSMTPFIKYGVMADMLMKQGEANDPERAEYCEGRFSEGVEVTKAFLGTK